jgi:dihydroorotate dehydrogenase (fumarate)
MVHGMDKWLDQNGIASVSELIGCAGSSKVKNPAMYERVQFMKYFGEFDQPVD